MKLQAWLDKQGKSRTWFGEQFLDENKNPKPVTASTVDGWCKAEGNNIPSRKYREEIKRITNGKVTTVDFF